MRRVLLTCPRPVFNFLLLSILFLASSLNGWGQTPGLIIKPAMGEGAAVLDPDGDGYVSQKTGGIQLGFTTPPNNDVNQSEIPYVAIIRPDPLSDILRGPVGGFCEIVGVDEAGNNAILVYNDGTNLLFRFRLGGYAPNSKSYSILMDTDQKFGFSGVNSDPYPINGNPGFEIEVVLNTNFTVDVYNVNGLSTGTLTASYPYDTHCQKSKAVTLGGGDADYFYDFYISLSDLSALGVTPATPLRIVALTTMNPHAAIGNNALSDVGGVTSGNNIDQIFEDLINDQTPTVPGVEVLDRSDCPTINGPITTNSTSISGSSTEANNTTIKIYKNASLLGTTTVFGNLWTYSLGISLLAGDVITATATASNEGESIANCNPRTVLAGNTPPCIAPSASNLVSSNGGHTMTMTFTGGVGYTLSVHDVSTHAVFGTPQPTTSATSYSISGLGGSDKLTNWYVRVTGNGCLSSSTTYCSGTYSTTPTITNPVAAGTTSISGTCGSAGTVTVFKNDESQGTATVSGTSWTKAGLILATGDKLFVTSIDGVNCMARSTTTTVTVVCSPSVTPVIDGNVYAGDNTLTGTCGAGATVTVYKDGISIGNAIVSGTTWSKSISSLVGNTTTFYVAATEPGKCEATSSSVTVQAVPVPSISGTYCGSVNTITGFITASSASIQLYKVGSPDIAIGSPASLNSSGDWTVSGLSLIGGDRIYAKASLPGGSTSTSTTITIGSKTGNSVTIVTNPIYEGTTSLSGTGTNGDVITLYIGGSSTIYSAVWTGSTWTISGIATYEFYPGASVYVTATIAGQCESDPSNERIVQCVAPASPSYSGGNKSYCMGGTGQLSLLTSETGVIYQLIDGVGVSHGLEYAGTGGAINLYTSPLYGDLSNIYVKAYKSLSPSCSTISSEVINFNLPSPSPTVTFTSTSLSVVQGTTTVNLSYTGKSVSPLADRYTIDYSIAANAKGFNDISSPTPIGPSPIVLSVPANPAIGTYYGTIIISSLGGSSCSTVYGFSITILSANSPPVIVNQSTNLNICYNGTTTLSVTAAGTITGYQWQSSTSYSGTYTNISGATSASYPTTALTAATYYRVIVTNGNGSVTSNITTVSVTAVPEAAGTISGTSTVCAGQNGVSYSVGAITNAISYSWSYSGTGAFINGTGSSVFINFGANATSGTLSVAGTNTCGSGTSSSYVITVNPLPIAEAGTNITTCSTSGDVNITSGASASNYSSVTWTSSGTGTFTNANSLSNATYSPSASDITAGIVTLTLTAAGTAGCGNATSTKTLTITTAPVATAGSDITTCTGTSAIAMTGATASGTYTGTPTWSGGTGTWVQNANPALATFTPGNASGSFTATLTLTGCSSITSTRIISWNTAPVPTFTSAPGADVCVNGSVTYTTESGKTDYGWTVPGTVEVDYSITAGGIGSGSNTVTIKWLTVGSKTVSVNYKNAEGCLGITPATSTTTVNALPTPSEIIMID